MNAVEQQEMHATTADKGHAIEILGVGCVAKTVGLLSDDMVPEELVAVVLRVVAEARRLEAGFPDDAGVGVTNHLIEHFGALKIADATGLGSSASPTEIGIRLDELIDERQGIVFSGAVLLGGA